MKLTRSLLALAVSFSLILPAIFVSHTRAVLAQNSNALQRGYRTGYSDGYMAGYRDTIDSLDKSITRHREYAAADRAYNKDFGALEDYRDGYRQGFEKGYEIGFEKKGFDSTTPADLARKGMNATPPSTSSISSEPLREQTNSTEASTPRRYRLTQERMSICRRTTA
jgi:flagellar biosynthesis/type III secretory pathway protein FliH